MTYHKKIVSPLKLYNIYIQNYNRFFNGFYTPTRKKELNNKKIEEYFINFANTNFIKLNESTDKLKEYLLWLFSKYGKVTIFQLHCYINEYLKENKNALESFYFKINTYLKKNKIEWESYIEGTKNCFPKVIEHYCGTKEFPFEFILHLNIFERLTQPQKKLLKVILRLEMMNIDKKLKVVEKNRCFFDNELEQIQKGKLDE